MRRLSYQPLLVAGVMVWDHDTRELRFDAVAIPTTEASSIPMRFHRKYHHK